MVDSSTPKALRLPKWALSVLRRRPTDKPNRICTARGISRLGVDSPHSHWLIGRGLCLYRVEDFAQVPKNRRRAALELKVPFWSPFKHTGRHCIWSGSTAMVWLWDADAAAPAPDAAASDAPRILPETVFLPRGPDGVHVHACQDGFELQHWQDDVLRDSLWLPGPPDASDMRRFLARQQPPVAELPQMPAAEESLPAHAAQPWAAPVTARDWLLGNEKRIAVAAVLAAAVAMAGLESRIWYVRSASAAAAGEIEAREQELGPLLADRAALANLRRLDEGLAAILAQPSQALLMSLVDRAIPTADATFHRWDYAGRELTVQIDDPALDAIAYIEALQREPLFEQVRVQLARGGQRLEIALQVKS